MSSVSSVLLVTENTLLVAPDNPQRSTQLWISGVREARNTRNASWCCVRPIGSREDDHAVAAIARTA